MLLNYKIDYLLKKLLKSLKKNKKQKEKLKKKHVQKKNVLLNKLVKEQEQDKVKAVEVLEVQAEPVEVLELLQKLRLKQEKNIILQLSKKKQDSLQQLYIIKYQELL